MTTVILESPYHADSLEGIAENVAYARKCMKDSLMRDESPICSHLLFTQCLDDNIPEERTLGIKAGLAWKADKTVVYIDGGVISAGMQIGIDRALAEGRPVEYRKLIWDNKSLTINPQNDVEK